MAIKQIIENIRWSYGHIPYTSKHYFAFLRTEKQLTGRISHWHHDMDKLLMFVFTPWLGKEISEIHRRTQKHHPTFKDSDGVKQRKLLSVVDWHEAVIDWECARITKPDKPLNAYDTMVKYYPWSEEYVMPVLREYKLI